MIWLFKNPPYEIVPESYPMTYFVDYADRFTVPANYPQREDWTLNQRQSYMMSLFHQEYSPRLLLRRIRRHNKPTTFEVLDGWQRVQTLVDFFQNRFQLPCEIARILPMIVLDSSREDYDNGEYYCDKLMVYSNFGKFIRTFQSIRVDMVLGIEKTTNPKHKEIAENLIKMMH